MTATYAPHIGRQCRPKKPVFTAFVSVWMAKKLRRQSVGRKYGYGVIPGAHDIEKRDETRLFYGAVPWCITKNGGKYGIERENTS